MTDPDGSGPPDTATTARLRFKSDLNAFRQRHPNSGYGTLAKILAAGKYGPDAQVSSTTLNDATHPLKPFPTARTVRSMVLALTGGNTALAQQWVDRRNHADAHTPPPQPLTDIEPPAAPATAVATPPAAPDKPAHPTPQPPEPHHGSARRRRTALWAAIALAAVVVLAGTNLTTYLLTRPTPVATPPPAHGKTGDNPINSRCLEDAQVAISTRANPFFLLEVIYSPACDAAWARITRTDDEDSGNEIRVTIYQRADPNGLTRQTAVEPDAHSAFTMMIVRSSPTDRLCTVGTVTFANKPDASGRPLCL